MRIKCFRILGLFLFLQLQMFAQKKEIVGVVYDDQGVPLPSASVIIKGDNEGVATDLEGRFQIKAEQGDVLEFSFIGFVNQEVKVGSTNQEITITMSKGTQSLKEVVLVAYGEKTKKSLTGSVSEIKGKAISTQLFASPLRALQGAIAGVSLTTSSGQPGKDPDIRIRGFGSVNAISYPLYVVDGVPFDGNGLFQISQSQIKSITVLKDAASATLYGSRAANGVIMITTHSGEKRKKAQITLNTRYGISDLASQPHELVNSKEIYELNWEALRNKYLYTDGLTSDKATEDASKNLLPHNFGNYNSTNVSQPVGTDGKFDPKAKLLWETDWLKAIHRNQTSFMSHNVSVQGGGDKYTYFANVDYLEKEGLAINSNFKRYTATLNITTELKDWIRLSSKNSFSMSKESDSNKLGRTMFWYYSIAPVFPIYRRNPDGSFRLKNGEKQFDYGSYEDATTNSDRPIFGDKNILGNMINSKNMVDGFLFSSVNSLDIDLYKGLVFTSRIGYQNYLYSSKEYSWYAEGDAKILGGSLAEGRNIGESYTFTNILNYKFNVSEMHNFDVKALIEAYDNTDNIVGAAGTGLFPNTYYLSNTTVPVMVYGDLSQERMLSFMGKVDYNFKDRYFLDLSYRRDGSSRFNSAVRYGDFYSVAASWIISDEDFLKNLSKKINLLKLRASYGQLGNKDFGVSFPAMQAYRTDNNNLDNPGVLLSKIVDKKISWETTVTSNIGLDYGFFDNRISGTIEYYNKVTEGLVFSVPLPKSTGNSTVEKNVGELTNSGLEFLLNADIVKTNDVLVSLNFNISTIENKFTSLPQKEIITGKKKYMVGKSVHDFFIQEYADVNPENGMMRWWKDEKDDNGKPTGKRVKTEKYSEADRYYVGSSIPDFYGGFGLNVSAYGFNLFSQFSYSYGGKIYDSSYRDLVAGYRDRGGTWGVYVKNRWKKPGDITNIPLLTTTTTDFAKTSTRYLFDNNYLRLSNVNLSYSVKKSLIKKYHLSDLSISLTAANLFTWQLNQGVDPEQYSSGTINLGAGLMRSYIVGLSLQF